MNPQSDVDFRVIDHPIPTGAHEQWKIVNYGEVPPGPSSIGYLQERIMLDSAIQPFEFADLFSKVNISLDISETSSDPNVEIPETQWFVNDKIHRIIVFRCRTRLPREMTVAHGIRTELSQTSAMEQFDQVFQKIGSFARLPENWDSYGAKAINRDCIIRGVVILKELIKLRTSSTFEIPVPFITPLSSGGIQIEWEKGERYLEISITSNPPMIGFFANDKVKEGQLTLEGSLQSATDLKKLLEWFVNGTAEALAHLSFDKTYEELAA